MVRGEAFGNAYDYSSESFKRMEMKLFEVDSPFVAKLEKQNINMTASYSTTRRNQRNFFWR